MARLKGASEQYARDRARCRQDQKAAVLRHHPEALAAAGLMYGRQPVAAGTTKRGHYYLPGKGYGPKVLSNGAFLSRRRCTQLHGLSLRSPKRDLLPSVRRKKIRRLLTELRRTSAPGVLATPSWKESLPSQSSPTGRNGKLPILLAGTHLLQCLQIAPEGPDHLTRKNGPKERKGGFPLLMCQCRSHSAENSLDP